MSTVRVPSPLRNLAGGRREVLVQPGPLRAVLEFLECECPGISRRLRSEDGSLLPYVNLYLDGNDVRLVGALDAEVGLDSVIDIVPAVSGGSPLGDANRRHGRDERQLWRRSRVLAAASIVLTSALTLQACGAGAQPPLPPPRATATAFRGPAGSTPATAISTPASTSTIQTAATSTPSTSGDSRTPVATEPRPSPASAASTPRPDLPAPVRAALADAQRLASAGQTVQLVSAELVEWPDASLGCPKPGAMYAQVVTSGYRVEIVVAGQYFEYHTDSSTRVELCNRS